MPTRWNSTHLMLENAKKLRPALDLMWNSCSQITCLKLSEEDWEIVEKLLDILTAFKQASDLLAGEKYPPLPSAVCTMNLLFDKIEATVSDLDTSNASSIDDSLIHALQAGRDKMLKFYKRTNYIYCVSLIFDPRHKIESFDLTEWGKEIKDFTLEKFKTIFKQQYWQEPVVDTKSNQETTKPVGLDLNALYISKKVREDWENEIFDYLESPRATAEQNILDWWKAHQKDFPNLARMARDYLCIMPSSVPSERFFSVGSDAMSKKRCALKDSTFREIMSISAWSRTAITREKICKVKY